MAKSTLYLMFALIATVVNLSTQEATSQIVQNKYEILFSILSGTLAGMIVKYQLDKKYIFKYEASSQKKDMSTFFLYSLMGIITTIPFWVTEYAFNSWFETKIMRYVGAIIGLSLGYVAKYHLDKKFVFIEHDNDKTHRLG